MITLRPQEIIDAAESLFLAEQNGQQIGLLSLQYPDMTLDDAYAIQQALVTRKTEAGLTITGRKIGLTSKTMQRALNIETPDSGVLFNNMHFDTGTVIEFGRFIEPRIEAEIAFEMGKPLQGSQVTRQDVIRATKQVTASLEILDTRILRQDPVTNQSRIIVDTIADNAANAGIVLGTKQSELETFDLRTVGAIVKRNGEVEETGLGAGVLDDPVTSVLWLVHRLADYNDGLQAGDIVLSGSFIRPIEAPPGSHFHADFGDFGEVSLSFAER